MHMVNYISKGKIVWLKKASLKVCAFVPASLPRSSLPCLLQPYLHSSFSHFLCSTPPPCHMTSNKEVGLKSANEVDAKKYWFKTTNQQWI